MHRKECRWRILAIQGGLDACCVAVTPCGQRTNEWGDNCRRSVNDVSASGGVVKGVCLLPHVCWGCDFDSCRRHGWMSVVSFVCCQVDVSDTG